MVVRSVGVWSVARIYGALSAAMGLIIGAFLALASLVGTGMAGPDAGPPWLAGVFGVGALIFAPIFYGVMGIVMGAFGAFLYNLFAGMVGGVEIDVA
jgi:hypothetical protein